MRKISFGLLALTLSLTACSNSLDGVTDGAGEDQNVQVRVLPENVHAHCLLTNARGSWTVEDTPMSVNIERGNRDLNVQCSAYHGYHGSAVFSSAFESSTIVNGWRSVIRENTGGLFRYPDVLTVPMTRDTSQDVTPSEGYAVAPSVIPLAQPNVVMTPVTPSPTTVTHHVLKRHHLHTNP